MRRCVKALRGAVWADVGSKESVMGYGGDFGGGGYGGGGAPPPGGGGYGAPPGGGGGWGGGAPPPGGGGGGWGAPPGGGYGAAPGGSMGFSSTAALDPRGPRRVWATCWRRAGSRNSESVGMGDSPRLIGFSIGRNRRRHDLYLMTDIC